MAYARTVVDALPIRDWPNRNRMDVRVDLKFKNQTPDTTSVIRAFFLGEKG